MKYVVTMNGKQYEVEVERMSAFHQLTREEIASGVSTPVVPVVAPARTGTRSEARTRTGTCSGSGSSTRRRDPRYLPDARLRARREGQCWRYCHRRPDHVCHRSHEDGE